MEDKTTSTFLRSYIFLGPQQRTWSPFVLARGFPIRSHHFFRITFSCGEAWSRHDLDLDDVRTCHVYKTWDISWPWSRNWCKFNNQNPLQGRMYPCRLNHDSFPGLLGILYLYLLESWAFQRAWTPRKHPRLFFLCHLCTDGSGKCVFNRTNAI